MMCRLRASSSGTVLSVQVQCQRSTVELLPRSGAPSNIGTWEKADDFLVQRRWCKLTGWMPQERLLEKQVAKEIR